MVTRLVNPHLICYLRAMDEGDDQVTPPRIPSMQELRSEHDLGSYTVAKLEKLFEEIGKTVTQWVADNPPA